MVVSTERNGRSDQVRVLPRSLRPFSHCCLCSGLHFATETEIRPLQYNPYLSDPFFTPKPEVSSVSITSSLSLLTCFLLQYRTAKINKLASSGTRFFQGRWASELNSERQNTSKNALSVFFPRDLSLDNFLAQIYCIQHALFELICV